MWTKWKIRRRDEKKTTTGPPPAAAKRLNGPRAGYQGAIGQMLAKEKPNNRFRRPTGNAFSWAKATRGEHGGWSAGRTRGKACFIENGRCWPLGRKPMRGRPPCGEKPPVQKMGDRPIQTRYSARGAARVEGGLLQDGRGGGEHAWRCVCGKEGNRPRRPGQEPDGFWDCKLMT